MMKLVGYRRGTSKKGSAYCMMNILTDSSDVDRSNGQVGQKTEEIFLPSNLVDMLKSSDIGLKLFVTTLFPVDGRFSIMSQSSKGGKRYEWSWYHDCGGCGYGC